HRASICSVGNWAGVAIVPLNRDAKTQGTGQTTRLPDAAGSYSEYSVALWSTGFGNRSCQRQWGWSNIAQFVVAAASGTDGLKAIKQAATSASRTRTALPIHRP